MNGCFHGPFIPSAAISQSLRQLKAAFTSAPVLVNFGLAKPIQLKKDALGYTIAGINLQLASEVWEAQEGLSNHMECGARKHWNLVAFWLHSILPASQEYMVDYQERLAIVMTCRH